jgi:hypothetical protein
MNYDPKIITKIKYKYYLTYASEEYTDNYDGNVLDFVNDSLL